MSRARVDSFSLSVTSAELEGRMSSQEGYSDDLSPKMLSSQASDSVLLSPLSDNDQHSLGDSASDAIECLVRDIQRISDCLAKLSSLTNVSATTELSKTNDRVDNSKASLCVQVHEALSDTLKVLRELLEKYCFLHGSEILSAASALTQSVKDLKFDVGSHLDGSGVQNCVFKFQAILVERVGFYLTWEMSAAGSEISSVSDHLKFSPSLEDVQAATGGSTGGERCESMYSQSSGGLEIDVQDARIADQLDATLMRSQGVELALERAKSWSKYCKELINYVQRRIQLEVKHAQEIKRLGEQMAEVLHDEDFLPLKTLYMQAFGYEAEFSQSCCESMKQLFEHKFVKPLESWREHHDRKRKELKEIWQRSNKNLQDAENELRKAKSSYVHRSNSYKKARDSALKVELSDSKSKLNGAGGERTRTETKIDKRRRLEEDAMLRKENAAKDCKLLEQKVELRQEERNKSKARVIQEARELFYQCDQTTRARTATYFQTLSTLWSPVPVRYQGLSDAARAYEPGTEFVRFVKQLPGTHPDRPADSALIRSAASDEQLSRFTDSDYAFDHQFNKLKSFQQNGSLHPSPSFPFGSSDFILDPLDRISVVPNHLFSRPNSSSNNSTDSALYNGSQTPPTNGNSTNGVANQHLRKDRRRMRRRHTLSSDAAMTHTLQKTHVPTKCSQCGAYTFFQTVQCIECGLAWHKSCLGQLLVPCSDVARSLNDQFMRKMAIFGVPLAIQVQREMDSDYISCSGNRVPFLLRACISELDRSGMFVKGLYRVCGVKSHIENLCEDFEQERPIDLNNVHPTIIASVIKLYLRQLPEPLLTFQLYPQLINVIKENHLETDVSPGVMHDVVVPQFKKLVQSLPTINYETLKLLILHLKRLTWFESENQMNATNLGIVFGPNLMWRCDEMESGPSLSSLLDTPLQNRIVEILISHAYELFQVNPTEEWDSFHELQASMQSSDHGDTKNSPAQSSSNDSNTFNDSGFTSSESTLHRDHHSTTPDLLKSRPLVERSPGSSHSNDMNSLAGSTSPSSPISAGESSNVSPSDVHRLLIEESQAIVREFEQQHRESCSPEKSAASDLRHQDGQKSIALLKIGSPNPDVDKGPQVAASNCRANESKQVLGHDSYDKPAAKRVNSLSAAMMISSRNTSDNSSLRLSIAKPCPTSTSSSISPRTSVFKKNSCPGPGIISSEKEKARSVGDGSETAQLTCSKQVVLRTTSTIGITTSSTAASPANTASRLKELTRPISDSISATPSSKKKVEARHSVEPQGSLKQQQPKAPLFVTNVQIKGDSTDSLPISPPPRGSAAASTSKHKLSASSSTPRSAETPSAISATKDLAWRTILITAAGTHPDKNVSHI